MVLKPKVQIVMNVSKSPRCADPFNYCCSISGVVGGASSANLCVVVGLNCHDGGLIPSTTAVPSAISNGQDVQIPSTTVVPSAGLSEEIFRRIDWITVKLHVFLCNIILNPEEITYIIRTILFAIYDYASLVAQL